MIFVLIIVLTGACRDDDLFEDLEIEIEPEGDTIAIETPDWQETTHGNNIDPDYSIVFDQDNVLRFDIQIESDKWALMQSDLSSHLGAAPNQPSPADRYYTPIWVPCSFKFNGREWYKVGIRYKGNSSLKFAFKSGSGKFSFKLDFDEFEDIYPAIDDQRFYGFKQLNLNNNFSDASLMHEKVASDLFRSFGLTSAHTAFCVIYLDHGNGPEYLGVYTLVEEVDDTVLKDQFGNEDGNLYKPEGKAATFSYGTFKPLEMGKKNNEEENDFSDVRALYDIINSNIRAADLNQWKSNLAMAFNVDVFIKWLASNIVIQNWDTYGKMHHNYYLYNNPFSGKLTWIPWDNNEALYEGKQGGALSISLKEVNNDWPLIRYLIDIPEYQDDYMVYLQQFIDEVFIPDEMIAVYSKHFEMIKGYAYLEQENFTYTESDIDFDQAVNDLKNHVQKRNDSVQQYLEGL
jgi:spore coat protein H